MKKQVKKRHRKWNNFWQNKLENSFPFRFSFLRKGKARKPFSKICWKNFVETLLTTKLIKRVDCKDFHWKLGMFECRQPHSSPPRLNMVYPHFLLRHGFSSKATHSHKGRWCRWRLRKMCEVSKVCILQICGILQPSFTTHLNRHTDHFLSLSRKFHMIYKFFFECCVKLYPSVLWSSLGPTLPRIHIFGDPKGWTDIQILGPVLSFGPWGDDWASNHVQRWWFIGQGMQSLLFWHVGWKEFTKSAVGKGLKGNVEAMEYKIRCMTQCFVYSNWF